MFRVLPAKFGVADAPLVALGDSDGAVARGALQAPSVSAAAAKSANARLIWFPLLLEGASLVPPRALQSQLAAAPRGLLAALLVRCFGQKRRDRGRPTVIVDGDEDEIGGRDVHDVSRPDVL